MSNTASNLDQVNNSEELEARISELESTLATMRARNARVDLNKSWETSWTRLLSVTMVTYLTMLLVFTMLASARPLFDALVPTTGFFLSTLSLPFIRRFWEGKMKR